VVRVCEIYDEELSRSGAGPVTASVLSFYRAQAQALEQQLLSRDLPMLDWQVIDVIDRIQGQQSDLVVLSFTRARRRGFGPRYGQWLQDLRRLNVACTRARRALVLVGHGRTLRRLGSDGGGPDGAQSRKAREFYANLFALLDSDEDFLRVWRL
jgi:superfamily I DNA and/or RNA helicase